MLMWINKFMFCERWIYLHDTSMGQRKIWVPDRNQTHDLPTTGRVLYPLIYENPWRARSFYWVQIIHLSNSCFVCYIQSYGKDVADLEEQMAAAKLDLKLVNFINTSVAVPISLMVTDWQILKFTFDSCSILLHIIETIFFPQSKEKGSTQTASLHEELTNCKVNIYLFYLWYS